MRCGIGSVSGVRRRNQQIYLMIKTFYEMAIQKTNRNMKRQENHIGNSKKKKLICSKIVFLSNFNLSQQL